jgi:hypothetical protein
MEEANAFDIVACSPESMFADGFTGNEPFFSVPLMTGLAKDKLQELKTLPAFDLTTEAGRKSLRAAIKPVKSAFADFEKNIKVVKKSFSEIPKKCDAVSKAMRDLSEPAIALAERPFAELKEQEAKVERWWKKEGVPHSICDLETLLASLSAEKPSIHSTEAERADFGKHLADYSLEAGKVLEQLRMAEKAEKEERERQAKEAARLADERRALEAEKAALEQQKRQAAVNPDSFPMPHNSWESGAPPALSEEGRKAFHRKAEKAMEDILFELIHPSFGPKAQEFAKEIGKAIYEGKIPGVEFTYRAEGI